MNNQPEVIDLTTESSSDPEDNIPQSLPKHQAFQSSSRPPRRRYGRTKEQARKRKHGVGSSSIPINPPNTPLSLSTDDSRPLFRYPYQDEPRPLKSLFLPSSEDDSIVNPSDSSRGSDDSTKHLEPIFNRLVREEEEKAAEGRGKPQPSQPRSQPRPHARNPPLSETREVVIGLMCPRHSQSVWKDKGKEKAAEVQGKGKGKME